MRHLFLIVGASGSGKSTLARKLLGQTDGYLIPSLVTREHRSTDAPGDLEHCDQATFMSMIDSGLMIEYEQFNDQWYGTSTMALGDGLRHDVAVKVCRPDGARSMMQQVDAYVGIIPTVFHVTASREVLVGRLAERGELGRVSGLDQEIADCRAFVHDVRELASHAVGDVGLITVSGTATPPRIMFTPWASS